MALNQPVSPTTQIGIANGHDEGYANLTDVAADLLPAGNATQLPAADPTNAGSASNTQQVLNNLLARINAVQAADMDKIADAFASGDGAISNSGTADSLSLALVPTAVADVLANSPFAMRILIGAIAQQPIGVRAILAQALLSTDANNSAVIGSDGLIYENDAAV